MEKAGDTAVFTFGRFNPPTTGHEKLIEAVAKQQAKNVLHDFFDHLNFEGYDRKAFKTIVTDDFHIFEKRINMSRKDFFDFVDSIHSESAISKDWILSNF